MNKYSLIMKLFFSFGTAILAGCTSITPMQTGTEKVIITKQSAPKNCQWRGKVSAVNEAQSMRSDQHSALLDDEYNRIRNQAAKLGANTVVLSSSSVMTDKKHWAAKTEHKNIASHVVTGDAYRCPVN